MSPAAQHPQLALSVGTLVAVHLGSAPGFAQETASIPAEYGETPAAQKSTADALMQSQEYSRALSCYRQSYGAVPSPALLYNQARALEMLGRRAPALEFLRRFDQEATPESGNHSIDRYRRTAAVRPRI